MFRLITLIATALCLFVVSLGAYVRLSDAGLGCPDWPGCYGKLTPTAAAAEINAAAKVMPDGPVTLPKAWKEMAHRYVAGFLGLLIAALMLLAWAGRRPRNVGWFLPTFLAAFVILQALFGKWTVTLLLKPAIVTGHLLGGMLIFALLVWLLAASGEKSARGERSTSLSLFASLALILVFMQIALGGWVSTNYAALACTDFPTCHGSFVPPNTDFEHGFHLFRELGMTASGAVLSRDALTAIHWVHRVGALVITCFVGLFAWSLLSTRNWRVYGLVLFGLLACQIALGILNVLLSLPLPLAVAHNTFAALLLGKLTLINYRIRH
jgi:heme a synthase